MDELINVAVEKGLGVASYIVVIYILFVFMKEFKDVMNNISATLIQIQLNLSQLNERVDKLEEEKEDVK